MNTPHCQLYEDCTNPTHHHQPGEARLPEDVAADLVDAVLRPISGYKGFDNVEQWPQYEPDGYAEFRAEAAKPIAAALRSAEETIRLLRRDLLTAHGATNQQQALARLHMRTGRSLAVKLEAAETRLAEHHPGGHCAIGCGETDDESARSEAQA